MASPPPPPMPSYVREFLEVLRERKRLRTEPRRQENEIGNEVPRDAEPSSAAPSTAAVPSRADLIATLHHTLVSYAALLRDVNESQGETEADGKQQQMRRRSLLRDVEKGLTSLQQGVRSKASATVKREVRDTLLREIAERQRILERMRATMQVAQNLI